MKRLLLLLSSFFTIYVRIEGNLDWIDPAFFLSSSGDIHIHTYIHTHTTNGKHTHVGIRNECEKSGYGTN